MRIRQIALVAREIEHVKTTLSSLLGAEQIFVDPKMVIFGWENIIFTIGDTFLEVVRPIKDGTTAGRLLDRRGGDGGYMVIVQVNDLKSEKNRLNDTDIRIIWETESERAAAIHLHPKDVPGAIASLDWMAPPGAWYWAGEGWDKRRARYAQSITAAEIQSDDPDEVAKLWGIAFNRPIDYSKKVPRLPLDSSEVRFVKSEDNKGPSLSAIDIEVIDKNVILDEAERLGLRHKGNCVTACGINLNLI